MSVGVTFALSQSSISNGIFIPRYYDPRIEADLQALSATHTLVKLSDLIARGHIQHTHGSYIPKIYYGTGNFPYIRTSDIANSEIKASPKHGLADHVFAEYSADQDVQVGDVLFVHEGTYLIGSAALITEEDGPITYQHHLAKFRVASNCPFSNYFFLAVLQSKIVQRQIRARQFSADIIDSVVGRLEEIVIPVPKDKDVLRNISCTVETAIKTRAASRKLLSAYFDVFDAVLSGESSIDLLSEKAVLDFSSRRQFLKYRKSRAAFCIKASAIADDILLPKYYDPSIAKDASKFMQNCDMKSLSQLKDKGSVSYDVGDEIGAINYGTGEFPFVRTSDFGSWELLSDAKHGVSKDIYDLWISKQTAAAGDILLVRDGTYLVGTNVILFPEDLPLLYCGGIYKIRTNDNELLSPFLLYALLNTSFVQRQIRNKQFTRDVIDTIGNRLGEVLLPIPRDKLTAQRISEATRSHLTRRNASRIAMTHIVATMP